VIEYAPNVGERLYKVVGIQGDLFFLSANVRSGLAKRPVGLLGVSMEKLKEL